MTLLLILALAALAVVPWAVQLLYLDTGKVVFQGVLTPDINKLDDIGLRTGTRYCWFIIPKLGRLLAEISAEKYELLNLSSPQATVTVVQYLFGQPKIESLLWQNETETQSADQSNKGLLLSAFYLLAGLVMLALSAKGTAQGSDFGQLASYWSAGSLVLSGFVLMLYDQRKFDLSKASTRILFLPLGTGRASLVLLLSICIVATIACFSSVNLLTLILGLNTAFATGSLAAILSKSEKPVAKDNTLPGSK
ncbi:MAG: hypothetical protein K8F91_01615 [Candidatus Obscuribacterales bacterium]|nr:hypothetical protein [Candidatus Obscuribacterales bacterium]